MKKTLSLILALVLVAALSMPALAKSNNGNAWGQVKKLADTEQMQNQGQQKEKFQNGNQAQKAAKVEKANKVQKTEKNCIQERVKKDLQEQYQAYVKNGSSKVQHKHFADVSSHWAAGCIDKMSAIGLFKGYPDGTFMPERQLTQAEALSLVMRVAAEDATADTTDEEADVDEEVDEDADEEVDESETELEDVPAWVRGDAGKASKKGIIKLNRFHSAVQASRAQTAVMIARALGLEPVDTADMPFKDGLLISQEDVGYILALYEEGIIKGTPNGNFNPNSAITRAEMATILQKLLEQKNEIVSVTLPETATVEQGKSITLKATVKYGDDSTDNNVEWSSSDTALATVEGGVVTAAADKLGKVTITAAATRGESTKSASCEVTVIEKAEVIEGTLEDTGRTGSHEGKVYAEYAFKVDGETISLAQDNVKSITQQKDDGAVVTLTANTDTTLWFNVQRETGKYTLTVVDQEDKTYAAVLDWTAPTGVVAAATGKEGEHEGNTYVEYSLGNLDLSSFTYMYQIKPDGQVIQLTANTDTNLWFKTNDQIAGTHTFLINQSDIWYSATISI